MKTSTISQSAEKEVSGAAFNSRLFKKIFVYDTLPHY